jgi:hypothetical protein
MTSDEVVDVVLGWAEQERAFVFVGNGILSRLVSSREKPFAYCLFGGMSLALPMALGFAAGRPSSRPLALEGDGNFWMGFGAQPTLRYDVLHVVVANGAFASTGGQPLGTDVDDPTSVVVASGAYRCAVEVGTPAELYGALVGDALPIGARLVWALVERNGSVPARSQATPRTVTRLFREAMASRGQ